jgi:hypothetical protein
VRKLVAWATLASIGGLLWAVEEARAYHVVNLVDLALQKVRQTHVHVEGFVTYVAHEADGDTHIRLCDSKDVPDMERGRCIVVECIPELPCERPPIGSKVAVEGVARYDKENGHKWSEVHPCEKLTVIQDKEVP